MTGLAFMALELAVVALVLVLLNARDRRRDRAVAAVLDMAYCDHTDVWAVVRPLAGQLLPDVAVVIGVRVDPARPATVSVAYAAPGSR